MKDWKLPFTFNRQERRGIFYLCLIIFVLQLLYYLVWYVGLNPKMPKFQADPQYDNLYNARTKRADTIEIYPFNPNYLTDFKGYQLGLTARQLDRLYTYRSQDSFIRSSTEFQRITEVPDSLLDKIAPYFRFPLNSRHRSKKLNDPNTANRHVPGQEPGDLNTVTAGELSKIRGIGPVLSQRIVRFRKALGGFLVDEQLGDVYGLTPEVVQRVRERYRVISIPEVEIINVNKATASELSSLVYIPYSLAEVIVGYREKVGSIRSFDEISALEGFPSEKIDRIRLYLSL